MSQFVDTMQLERFKIHVKQQLENYMAHGNQMSGVYDGRGWEQLKGAIKELMIVNMSRESCI